MTSLKLNIVANYIGKTWAAILGILLVPLYIKFIGIEAYGLVGFYTTLTSVIGILDLGIGSTVNRELARRTVVSKLNNTKGDLVRTLEFIYWGIAILAGAIIIVGAPFIARSWLNANDLNTGTILTSIQLMAGSIALRFPMSLYQGGLMGLQKQVLVNLILVANGTLRGVGAVLILWLVSPTVEAFFLWHVFTSMTGSVALSIAIWSSIPKTKPKFRLNIITEIWKYAAAVSASSIVGIILSQLDKIILSRLLPLKTFGYYSIASTGASLLWMIIIPFNTAIFPKLVQIYESKDKNELKKLFHNFSQFLSWILLPIGSILIFYSKEILQIWIKDPMIAQNSYLIMSLLSIGIILNGLSSLPANCAPAFGWPVLITYTNLIQSVIIIPLIIGLVYWLQGVGASIAWIIMNSTYLFIMSPRFFTRYLNKEMGKWYLKDISVPACVAFSIGIISKIISPSLISLWITFAWISISGVLAFILTGLSLSSVRSYLSSLLLINKKQI